MASAAVRRPGRPPRPTAASRTTISYYFDPEKVREASAALARQSRNPADYLVGPDLAIEIDISRSKVDRPLIHAALRIAGVWRFDGSRLVIERRQPDGSYRSFAWAMALNPPA